MPAIVTLRCVSEADDNELRRMITLSAVTTCRTDATGALEIGLGSLDTDSITVGGMLEYVLNMKKCGDEAFDSPACPADAEERLRAILDGKRGFSVVLRCAAGVVDAERLQTDTDRSVRRYVVDTSAWQEEEAVDGRMMNEEVRIGLGAGMKPEEEGEEGEMEPQPLLDSFDIEGVVKFIKEKNITKILCMTGAGISVAAGIPDFRTPGTGLYSNLQKYNLPYPEAIFTLDHLRENPEAFFMLAKELWPGLYAPTHVHHFIAMLQKQGRLLRCYTQNIDCLEREAGLPGHAVVEAHGSFAAAHCIDCGKEMTIATLKEFIFSDCIPHCISCTGIVKPDIVFFGEQLPDRFTSMVDRDALEAELLLVFGTSLQVQPFASLAELVREDIPRVLINNQLVGDDVFDFEANLRDVALLGDCQATAASIADELGWAASLNSYVAEGREKVIAGSSKPSSKKKAAATVGSSSSEANKGKTTAK